MVEDDEALHAHALLQDGGQQVRQVVVAGRAPLLVVVRDESAHGHARAEVQQRQHGPQHRATHVLEVHVDAARAGRGE
ncbi:hypothetical protein FQZ97_973010 [compost metagenome]